MPTEEPGCLMAHIMLNQGQNDDDDKEEDSFYRDDDKMTNKQVQQICYSTSFYQL